MPGEQKAWPVGNVRRESGVREQDDEIRIRRRRTQLLE